MVDRQQPSGSTEFRSFILNGESTLPLLYVPGAPLTHFNDGGGGPSDFFGSEILAQSDFFGSLKEARIFLGREKKTGIF